MDRFLTGLGAILGAVILAIIGVMVAGQIMTASAASAPVIVAQVTPGIVEYCIREWQVYDDGPDDQTQDGPRREQIVGSRYDFRPESFNVPLARPELLKQWGLFAYSSAQTGPDILLCVPADPSRLLRAAELAALEIGFDKTLTPGTFSAVMFDLATIHADNTQTLQAASLRPGIDKRLNFFFGDGLFRSEDFDLTTHRAADSVRGAYQETYRIIRTATLAGEHPPGTHQRYLDFLADQFRTSNHEQFIPDDLPVVPRIRHATTITDDLDDCATGGSVLTDDCNNDWAVTSAAVDCDVEVQSGADDYIHKSSGGDTCENFLVAGVATDDHSFQITINYLSAIESTMEHAIFNRKACGNTTRTWYSLWEEVSPVDEQRIRERTAGSDVTLATDGTPDAKSSATDYVYKFVSIGSDLEGFVDAGSTITASDATITGNLCAGIRLRSANGDTGRTTGDLITFADEGAAPARRIFIWWG